MVPVAVRELVMTGLAKTAVRTNVSVPVPPALVAPRVIELVPVAVSVPEMSPVVVFTLNPEGNPVAL